MVATKKGEMVSGQKAWQKTGIEMSPEEMRELKQLKDRLAAGEVLPYPEQNRLHVLERKQITTAHVL